MKDLKLNADGDLALEDADLALVEGAAEIGQGVKLALGSIRGEYILDTSAGLDLFGLVLGKPDPALRDAEIKREMLARPGVAALVSYAAAVDASTRVLTVSAELRAEDGERIVERNTRIYIPRLLSYEIRLEGEEGALLLEDGSRLLVEDGLARPVSLFAPLTTLSGAEKLAIVQDGTTVYVTAAELAAWIVEQA